jgi:hypothetical protein
VKLQSLLMILFSCFTPALAQDVRMFSTPAFAEGERGNFVEDKLERGQIKGAVLSVQQAIRFFQDALLITDLQRAFIARAVYSSTGYHPNDPACHQGTDR